MSAAHTPGPWFVRRQPDPERPNGWMLPHYWHVESVDGRWVADFPRLVPEAQEQQEADIHLITTAPELLRELRTTAAMLSACRLIVADKGARDEMTEQVKTVEALLAKATGSAS